jgi:hypothetical protein
MQPVYPSQSLPRPFADNGTWQNIPDAKPAEGRASYQEGFPVETQLPLSQGGVAPNRTDFNGILHILSAMAHWQQSGGQWKWSATLDYSPPAMVAHGGKLWWAVNVSGPSSVGAKTPGTNETYWLDLLSALGGLKGEGTASFSNPVGAIIMYYGMTAPEGYLPCDGSAFSATDYPQLYALLAQVTTPDMRGLFVRGYDASNLVDPNGATRGFGSVQQDALQNIVGTHSCDTEDVVITSGAFYNTGETGFKGAKNDTPSALMGFDASRVARTATETRPKNINLLFCIKHD